MIQNCVEVSVLNTNGGELCGGFFLNTNGGELCGVLI